MNVLLTCAGRRNYLIDYFRRALGGRGRVFAADHSDLAPALQDADESFIVPVVCHRDYAEQLLTICHQHHIGMIISLNDLELPVLAAARKRFEQEGIIVVVSEPQVINVCYDKWETTAFARKQGLAAPATYLSGAEARKALAEGALKFPLVVKPRWGSASFALEICEDEDELTVALALTRKLLSKIVLPQESHPDQEKNILIQEKIEADEYHLDIVNDLRGRYACTLIKKKLAMRAGETDKAMTVDHPGLQDMGERIGKGLGHVGNLDCDVMMNDRGAYLIDMNPRFGGGYPFSHTAGADIPAALLAWAEGRTPDASWLKVRPGVRAAKYDRLVLIR